MKASDMDRYVLVTGAFGGMGRDTVRLLVQRGYKVLALDMHVGEKEQDVFPIQCDVTDEDSVLRAVDRVREITSEVYAVVHYAGIYMLDSLIEMDSADYEKIFRVNLFGAFNVNKAIMPLLKGGSRILIVTSELAALNPLPFTGVYAVSKAALDKYAFSLKMELQLLNISVSVLRAGAVNTGMLGVSTKALEKFCDRTKAYTVSSARFKRIVNRVEARHITTQRLAEKSVGIIQRIRPKFAYTINRNPLLVLLNLLPKKLQFFVIKKVLK